MQVVILAGGYGTRISEGCAVQPKPMVEIGGRTILWHIMKINLAHGLPCALEELVRRQRP